MLTLYPSFQCFLSNLKLHIIKCPCLLLILNLCFTIIKFFDMPESQLHDQLQCITYRCTVKIVSYHFILLKIKFMHQITCTVFHNTHMQMYCNLCFTHHTIFSDFVYSFINRLNWLLIC